MNDRLVVSTEIADAIARGAPVVALESSLIAHGLPAPLNLETAAAMEGAVRDGGAVPATIGVIEGRIRVGLDGAEMARLGTGGDVLKLGRRDLAHALARRLDGGTTVAGTMACARIAGIEVLATGGIGGVHRGVRETMDVSADLDELARTPVAVVCAGAKAILDLPRTLEYLETRGVPVVGFGSDSFPAFYARESGLAAPMRLDTPQEVARLMTGQWALGLGAGMVIANPPPDDTALDGAELETAIRRAVDDARTGGVGGKALTPFLLDRVAALTDGRSLAANAALLASNAALAARIAVAYAEMRRKG